MVALVAPAIDRVTEGVDLSTKHDRMCGFPEMCSKGCEGLRLRMAASNAKATGNVDRRSSVVNLTVQAFGGNRIASLRCSLHDTIYEVKQRLLRISNDGTVSLQLVQGTRVLHDTDRLLQCAFDRQESEAPTFMLTCVRAAVSSLAALADDALGDTVDSVFRHEYTLSERLRPCADGVTKTLPRELRAKCIAWASTAFDTLSFDPDLLYAAAFTFDRFCATEAAPVDERDIGLTFLAAICTEMKLSSHDRFPFSHLERVIRHLCQDSFEMKDILKYERKMLSALAFEVGSPTSFTFFAGLRMRLIARPTDETDSWLNLGEFFLRLALLDPDIQYGHSHAVIAASALSASLRVCRAPVTLRTELLEDLAAYRSAAYGTPEEAVLACERDIVRFWQSCLHGMGESASFYPSVHSAFEGVDRHNVARRFTPAQWLEEVDAASKSDKQ